MAGVNLATRFLVIFLLIAGFTVLAGVVAATGLQRSSSMFIDLYEEEMTKVTLLHRLETSALRSRVNLLLMAETHGEEQATYQQLSEDYLQQATEALEAYRSLQLTSAEAARAEEVARGLESYQELVAAAGIMDTSGDPTLVAALVAASKEDFMEVLNVIDTLVSEGEAAASAARQEAERMNTVTQRQVWAVSLLAVLVALAMGRFLSRSLVVPLVAMARLADRIGEGDLTVSAHNIRRRDEIGRLASSLEWMIDHLRAMIGRQREVAGQIDGFSRTLLEKAQHHQMALKEVGGAVDDMAAGAQRQAVFTTEIAAAADQTAREVQAVAASMEQIAGLVREAGEQATQGSEVIRAMSQRAAHLGETAATSSLVVDELSQQSQSVGQIIQTMAAIAKQTNLLALNAAIEAARAGGEGRGFAVVAEEIHKLAAEASRATEEIGDLVGGMEEKVRRAMEVMQQGIGDAGQTLGAIEQAAHKFTGIKEAIEKINEQAEKVAGSVEELTASGEEVARRIEEIAGAAQDVGARNEEVDAFLQEQQGEAEQQANAVARLAALAQQLEELGQSFRYQ